MKSRNCLLHLRTILGWQRIQKKVLQTKTGCIIYPDLRDKERTQSWCSTWQNRNTKEYHIAWNAWKRCCKNVDSQGGHFTRIHDRFLRDPVYRESQLVIGWTEQKCQYMDELAKEDHTDHLTQEEYRRYQGQWHLTLNNSGQNGLMKLRSDFRAAVSIKNRLHREMASLFKRFMVGHVWMELVELIRIFFKWSSFCYSWFRLQSIAIHCDRRGV